MIEIQSILKERAALLGDVGADWLADLPARLTRLCTRWSLTPERVLEGGTEAVVIRVRQAQGEPAALKLGLPDNTEQEAEALRLAAGRGYAELIAHAPEDDALVLAWVGAKLIDSGLPADEQMRLIVDALKRSWVEVSQPGPLMDGASKARWHLDFMRDEWHRVADRFPERVLDLALEFAAARKAAFNPATSVLVHGDAHAWNALIEPGEPITACKLIDPDGLFMEAAYDVAVSMREWPDLLLQGDTPALAEARCDRLADLSGQPREPIWQWGFIEIVSTGLVYAQLGDPKEGARYLELATRLAELH